jgi:hypothetical protein
MGRERYLGAVPITVRGDGNTRAVVSSPRPPIFKVVARSRFFDPSRSALVSGRQSAVGGAGPEEVLIC